MRVAILASALALIGAGCGQAEKLGISAPTSAAEAPGGEQGLIAAATTISDTLGGCIREGEAGRESKVASLANGTIVMVSCSQGPYSFTDRMFSLRDGAKPELLTLADYDAGGWVAVDQASMAELDAGTGTLTTFHKTGDTDTCGSEGRYQWDGQRFVLQELRWQACGEASSAGLPFPVVWPTQTGSPVDPGETTPAP